MYDQLKQQLKRDEDLRNHPYRDSMGKLTIGIGRNLDDKGISDAEAYHLLDNDIEAVRAGLEQHIPWINELDEARRGVLMNMAFNLGVEGLMAFQNMLSAVKTGDWQTAAAEMKNSRWWGQVGVRAERLQVQMLSGVWQ